MSEAAPLLASRGPASHRERVAAALDLGALAPTLRTLLTTDGTVTETLAALHGEEVGVRVLAQAFGTHAGDDPDAPDAAALEIPGGTRVLERTIALVGAESGRIFAAARSGILPDRLPKGLQEGLLAGREPLGQLMLGHRLETFREIVACGRCSAAGAPHLGPACAEALGVRPEAPVAWRTYRVTSGGRPVMVITEYFPERSPGYLSEAPA